MKSLTYQDPSAPDEAAGAPSRRLWLLATVAGAVFVALAVAFALLVTSRSRTVDALVIVTLPSSAEVVFDGKPLGPAPVKLEGVRVGAHVVTASKDGFVAVEQEIFVEEGHDEPVEIELKPIAPFGSVARTPAEQIEEFTSLAEDAVTRGELVIPVDRSALYYADAILSLDRKNRFAHDLRGAIRTRLLADARAAVAARDLTRAREVYEQLELAFPGEEGAAGLSGVVEQLRRERSRVAELVARGEAALRAGRLIEPADRSAYAFAAQALAIDPDDARATGLRRKVRDRALARARGLLREERVEEAAATLRRMVTLFPDERSVRAEFDALMSGRALEALRTHREAGLRAFGSGGYRQAVQHLGAAVQLGAADAATRTALGVAHLRLGNTGEALGHLRRARKLGGTDEFPRERLDAMIAELEGRPRRQNASSGLP
jgi:tetratricopeptide (TPR) repeat protein